MSISVDLTDPQQFEAVKEQYLDVGVCPVLGASSPGPLQPVTLVLRFSEGRELKVAGTVIQELGKEQFLVQLSESVDFERYGVSKDSEESDLPVELTLGREGDSSSLYRKIQSLTTNEKRRLARNGNKTARQLLVKDSNKSLHLFVINNPKITLDEILEYSKSPQLSQDAIKMIVQNPSWLRSRQVVFNLTLNPATPMDIASRLVDKLSPTQWRVLANSNRVRTPIAAAAKKKLIGRLS